MVVMMFAPDWCFFLWFFLNLKEFNFAQKGHSFLRVQNFSVYLIFNLCTRNCIFYCYVFAVSLIVFFSLQLKINKITINWAPTLGGLSFVDSRCNFYSLSLKYFCKHESLCVRPQHLSFFFNIKKNWPKLILGQLDHVWSVD